MEKIFTLTDMDYKSYHVDEINELLASHWSVKSVTMASSEGRFFTIIILEERING